MILKSRELMCNICNNTSDVELRSPASSMPGGAAVVTRMCTWPTFSDWAFSQIFSLGHLARFSVPAPTPTVSAFYAFCHLPCHFLQRQQCECVCDLILGVAAASQIVNLPLAELPQNIPLCSNLHVELALLQLHSYCVLT